MDEAIELGEGTFGWGASHPDAGYDCVYLVDPADPLRYRTFEQVPVGAFGTLVAVLADEPEIALGEGLLFTTGDEYNGAYLIGVLHDAGPAMWITTQTFYGPLDKLVRLELRPGELFVG
jgi:hypothetical protein